MPLPAGGTLTVLREPTRFGPWGCVRPDFLGNRRHYNVFRVAILLKQLHREFTVFSQRPCKDFPLLGPESKPHEKSGLSAAVRM
jgi:hypothetical protein